LLYLTVLERLRIMEKVNLSWHIKTLKGAHLLMILIANIFMIFIMT